MSEVPQPEFSRSIPLGDVSHKKRSVKIIADAVECAALTHRLGILKLRTLNCEATFSLSSFDLAEHTETIDVFGTISAQVVQSCVVTNEPLESTIVAEFQGVVADLMDMRPETGQTDDDDVTETPEILGEIIDSSFDLGEISSAQISLELDPFPRKVGASFTGYSTERAYEPDMEKLNPFAVLSRLKDNRD